jgi:cytochrome c biogenesis protein CcdA
MTTFISEGMITDKLTKTIFTKIILFATGFLAVFLHLRALAMGMGAMKS